MGNYSYIIEASQVSMELAEIEKKDEFVRFNMNYIRDWETIELNNKLTL